MKELIKKIIITSKPINLLYVFVLRLLNKTSKQEILKRSQLSIFDYESTIEDMALYPTDPVIDNNFYGLNHWLQKYMGKKLPLNSYIEHGFILGSLVKNDAKKWWTPKIITFGSAREDHIKKVTSKPVLKIGPYIHYADDFLSDLEFKAHKQDLGKTLTVFPSHSIKNVESLFNNNDLISFIESKEVDFDTVIICLYWRDALNKELVQSYLNKGYRITSAGHIHDTNFLARLKSIIKLSDFVVSNSVGTQNGYITYLNKPQMIIEQKVDYNVSKNDTRTFTQRNDENFNTAVVEMNNIIQAFDSFSFEITSHQRDVIHRYWGLNQLKSPEEIENFITS
jgi:hypothetical protein